MLSHLRQHQVAKPPDAVDIVPVDVPGGEVGEVLLHCSKGLVAPVGAEGVGVPDGGLHRLRREGPDLQGVVHAAGYKVLPFAVYVLQYGGFITLGPTIWEGFISLGSAISLDTSTTSST